MSVTACAWGDLRSAVQAELSAGAVEHWGRLSWNSEQIHAMQRRALAELLAHSAEHSPFHARRLHGIDIDAVDPKDMSDLPVMTKAVMMDHLDEVFTDRALRRNDIESTLRRTTLEPIPVGGRYIALASGGCSGMRGVFVLDQHALA